LHRVKLFLTIGLAAGALLLIGTACTPGELQALEGTLQNMDTVSGNVTVKLKDGGIQTYNFNDVSVSTIRQALGKASIEIGDSVTIRRDRDGKVRRVEARAAEVEGVIKSLGTANVTITDDHKKDITHFDTTRRGCERHIRRPKSGSKCRGQVRRGQRKRHKDQP
jgi:hypothetical protein